MFTGIIEEQSVVVTRQVQSVGHRLSIKSPWTDLIEGESIAVNGVCLTLLPESKDELLFDVSPETLALTTLGLLQVGDHVNLERAMLATTRWGGHYVSGHVDATAIIHSLTIQGDYIEIMINNFTTCAKMFVLPKGSITLDGVSLTINAVEDDLVRLMLVPHTLAKTTFGQRKAGQRINVEFDYLTRIIAHQLRQIEVKE